jgi:Hypothetical protein (DUF2513)
MQIAFKKNEAMKRDMDLVRDLLLGVEADPRLDGTKWIRPDERDNLGVVGIGPHSKREIAYHLELLIEAGLIEGRSGVDDVPAIARLTWQGHEFLDNIRDPEVWAKTKERLQGLQTVALSVIVEVAKAEMKKRLGLQ